MTLPMKWVGQVRVSDVLMIWPSLVRNHEKACPGHLWLYTGTEQEIIVQRKDCRLGFVWYHALGSRISSFSCPEFELLMQ